MSAALSRNVVSAPVLPGNPGLRGILSIRRDHFFDGVMRPDAYGMELAGTCKQPEIDEGDLALMSPAETPVAGDYVGLFSIRPKTMPLIKRLVIPPPFFGEGGALPRGDLVVMVVVYMLNPPRQLPFWSNEFAAMHRVVGLVRRAELATIRKPAPR